MALCSLCYINCGSSSAESSPVILCPNCSRVAYCTEGCRTLHWEQGHKQWCQIPYGVEGADWEVVPISPKKGNGIIAKRPFEKDERIMVERMYSVEEIGSRPCILRELVKLEPLRSDDVELKIMINSIGSCDDRGTFGGICIRMSRINHACDPNAVTYYDDETRWMVLHAARPIAAGEEVTISYTEFLDPTCTGDRSVHANHSSNLLYQYGIVCPGDCACRSGPSLARLMRSRELEATMLRLAGEAEDEQVTIGAGLERVRFHNTDSPLRVRFRVRLQLFKQAEAMGIRLQGLRLHELACALTRPGSTDAQRYIGA
jgi:hypothetical protein